MAFFLRSVAVWRLWSKSRESLIIERRIEG